MRTVFWEYDRHVMRMIDQRLLPFETVVPEYDTYQAVADAIRDMVAVSYTHLDVADLAELRHSSAFSYTTFA